MMMEDWFLCLAYVAPVLSAILPLAILWLLAPPTTVGFIPKDSSFTRDSADGHLREDVHGPHSWDGNAFAEGSHQGRATLSIELLRGNRKGAD